MKTKKKKEKKRKKKKKKEKKEKKRKKKKKKEKEKEKKRKKRKKRKKKKKKEKEKKRKKRKNKEKKRKRKKRKRKKRKKKMELADSHPDPIPFSNYALSFESWGAQFRAEPTATVQHLQQNPSCLWELDRRQKQPLASLIDSSLPLSERVSLAWEILQNLSPFENPPQPTSKVAFPCSEIHGSLLWPAGSPPPMPHLRELIHKVLELGFGAYHSDDLLALILGYCADTPLFEQVLETLEKPFVTSAAGLFCRGIAGVFVKAIQLNERGRAMAMISHPKAMIRGDEAGILQYTEGGVLAKAWNERRIHNKVLARMAVYGLLDYGLLWRLANRFLIEDRHDGLKCMSLVGNAPAAIRIRHDAPYARQLAKRDDPGGHNHGIEFTHHCLAVAYLVQEGFITFADDSLRALFGLPDDLIIASLMDLGFRLDPTALQNDIEDLVWLKDGPGLIMDDFPHDWPPFVRFYPPPMVSC